MPESVTLTRRALLDLAQGLMQLDAIKESEKELVPLQFDAKVSYRLMRTHQAVMREKALFDRLDREAAKVAGFVEGMSVNDASAQKANDYHRRRADLLDEEVTLEGVFLVSVEQLLIRPEEFRKIEAQPRAAKRSESTGPDYH